MPHTPSPLVFAAPLAVSHAAPADPAAPEGVFDFDDVRAMREEYEERILRVERERDAAVDVVRNDAVNRIARLAEDGALRASSDARARQDLIEDLTHELATAREEGELKARGAERQRDAAESRLMWAAEQLQQLTLHGEKLHGELVGTAAVLHTALAETLAPAAGATLPAQAAPPPIAVLRAGNATGTPTYATASTHDGFGKRRKIRLR